MSGLLDQINAWYAALIIIVGGLVGLAVTTRDKWAKSKTNAVMEAAQQAGIASMVAALTASQVREREAWAQVTSIRVERDQLKDQIGGFREDVAELRSQHDSCEKSLEEFRAQILRMEITHKDERRRDTNTISNQRHLIGVQARQLQAAGLDPNITGILGDIGGPIGGNGF